MHAGLMQSEAPFEFIWGYFSASFRVLGLILPGMEVDSEAPFGSPVCSSRISRVDSGSFRVLGVTLLGEEGLM